MRCGRLDYRHDHCVWFFKRQPSGRQSMGIIWTKDPYFPKNLHLRLSEEKSHTHQGWHEGKYMMRKFFPGSFHRECAVCDNSRPAWL